MRVHRRLAGRWVKTPQDAGLTGGIQLGSPTTASDIRLSDFDRPVTISEPAGALDLESLAASAGAA